LNFNDFEAKKSIFGVLMAELPKAPASNPASSAEVAK